MGQEARHGLSADASSGEAPCGSAQRDSGGGAGRGSGRRYGGGADRARRGPGQCRGRHGLPLLPLKADLISELIAEVSRDELAAIRRAADAAPGPSSALAAAVTTVAVHTLSQRRLAWGILAEPVDVDVSASRLASRREIAGEIAARIDAAVRAGHLPAQDTALAATALLGALHEALVGPLAPDNLDDPVKMRDAVQTVTLLALRAVGVMDARARGLVVQQTLLPTTKALVGA